MSIVTPELEVDGIQAYIPNSINIEGFAYRIAELGDLDAVVSVQSELEHVRYMNRRLENVRITVEGDVEGYQELFLKLYDDFLEANGF